MSYDKGLALLIVVIGVFCFWSAATYVVEHTENPWDNIVVTTSRTILDTVPILIIEIEVPFLGLIGVSFTLGGSAYLIKGGR